MKVNLIYILLINFFEILCSKFTFKLDNMIPILEGNITCNRSKETKTDIIISTYMNDSIINFDLFDVDCSTDTDYEYNFFYIKYYNCKEMEKNYYCMNNPDDNNTYDDNTYDNDTYDNYTYDNNFCFNTVNFSKPSSKEISSVMSLNNNLDSLIILNYINKSLIIDNEVNNYTYYELLKEENLCYNNNSLKNDQNKRFVCKLDYILLGHEDLDKDDVYLAKEIKEKNPIAYLDNLLSFCIFPEEYLDYFFSSFFSELNDGCEKENIQLNDTKNLFFYITCPKKKIEIYTKRRKLSVIINKFSYQIINLFNDSFDFLEEKNSDNYYFNIIFERNRKDFILGKNFFNNITIGTYNNTTYIYSKNRVNYTDALTDINSKDFEKWVYILTASSFTFVLLFFTIIGCLHSRKVKKELNEMLNN